MIIIFFKKNDNNNTSHSIYSAVTLASSCESSLGLCDEYSTMAGDCRTLDQANRLEPQTYHHLLLLLNLKTDTHFTILWRVEG